MKIIVTRGTGGRGYCVSAEPNPTRILGLYPWPSHPREYTEQGIRTLLCKNRLGANPQLAGLKHLNRLEQILARQEWSDSRYAEGIMLDVEGSIIEGTMSNLFIVRDGTLYTPSLKNCGVAGIIRGIILEKANVLKIPCKIGLIELTDLLSADELFLTNSIIGIWPVREIEQCDNQNSFHKMADYKVGEITQYFQTLLEQLK